MKVRDRVFGAKVDPDVIKIINNLQDGSFESNPNEPIKEYSDYLGDRTTYARMWTAVTIYPHEEIAEETKKQKQDRISKTAKNTVYIVNENRENAYDVNPNESLGQETQYMSQLSENPYLKPPSGITSVSSKTEGSLGVLRRTSVEFVIHNKKDFEDIFLPFFLRPGARVCVDFGWSDKKTSELYDPVEQITNKDLTMEQFDSFIYGNVDDDDNKIVGELNKPLNVGLMNTVVGDVVNYDAKLTELGSFQCNVELISRNTSLLDKGVDDDNSLKYVFTNFIEDYLLQMLIHRKGIKTDFDEGSLDAFQDVVDEKARKKLLDALTSNTAVGKIDQVSSQLGFYYQDLSDNTDDGENDKEMMYINYGLFEDFFLNNIVVNYRDVTAESDKGVNVKSQIKYDSSENFIRYVSDLEDLQKLPLTDSDNLPTFLYNTYWENSYNSNPKADKQIGKDNNKRKNFLRGKLKKEPIRELFISVPLIKQSFESANNVNDALVNIFGGINEDSFDIFNIQMTPNNEAGTSVGFHDIFITENQDQELIFDVTSHRSIVKSADLTFKTPKSGLSSMIAISNLSEPTVFSQNDLANFNMLNVLKKDSNKNQKTIIRSLPLTSDNDLENVQGFGGVGLSAEDIKEFSNVKGLVSSDNSTGLGDTAIWEVYDRYVKGPEQKESDEMNVAIKNYYDSLKQAKEDAESEEKDKEDDKKKKETPKNKSEKNVIIVNTEREQLGQQARKNALLLSGENTISPILPVDLTLTVYGNNYLVVGDVFSVNFLPKHYQDRIFFQIVGIEQKISTSGWDTTYNTVMRVKSAKKKVAYGSSADLDRIFSMKIKPSKKMIEKNLTEGNIAASDEFKKSITEAVTLESNLFFPPYWLKFTLIDMKRDVDRTLEDKEKSKSKRRKMNAFGLYTRFAGAGLKDPFSFATMYALTTFFMPNDKTNPDFNLDMDLFKLRYTGEGNVDPSVCDKKGESSEIKILANRKDDGKSGELRKAIDSEFDDIKYGFAWGDTEAETAVVKFTQQMQSQFKLDNIEHQFNLGSLPVLDGILYNITGDEKFYQMKLNREVENIFIVPRLMKKKNFSVGDLKKFCFELTKRAELMVALMDSLISQEQGYGEGTPATGEFGTYRPDPEPENPGYPFTNENYPASPFGTYPTAFDARLKLSQRFGFDSYIAYKHSKTLDERKADWDNNSDIWEN